MACNPHTTEKGLDMTARKTMIWLACGLAIASLADAAPDKGPRGEGGWRHCGEPGEHPLMEEGFREGHLERMAGFLDLSPQQAEQWRQTMESRADGREAEFESMQNLHERIRELASADTPDATAVGELVIQAHQRMETLEAEREAFHAELESILTPEQQERFEALRELRPDRGAGGRHRPGPGHHMGERFRHGGPQG
jgi:Spy/CpxP family protein refolding chaperone